MKKILYILLFIGLRASATNIPTNVFIPHYATLLDDGTSVTPEQAKLWYYVQSNAYFNFIANVIPTKKLIYPYYIFAPVNHYIANSGRDSDPGTISQPWQTVTKVNSSFSSFSPGDSVLFKRGDNFATSTGSGLGLITNANGTLANPIVIGAYGTGTAPILSGFTTASGWTSVGSGVYASTALSSISTCRIVAFNGSNQAMGRFPHTGYLTISSGTGSSLTATASLATNWTGATVTARTTNYWFETPAITSASGATLNVGSFSSTPQNGYGFFIQNDIRTCTNLGDWYFNPSSELINVYFGGGGPSTNVVQASTVDFPILLQNDYITIRDLNIIGANTAGIYENTTHTGLNVINTSFNNCDYGMFINHQSNFSIVGCSFQDIQADPIQLDYCSFGNLTNLTINRAQLIPGMSDHLHAGLYMLNGTHDINVNTISITNVAYDAISYLPGNNIKIQNFYINGYCQLLDDGGAVAPGGGVTVSGGLIANGIIMNGQGNQAGSAFQATRRVEGGYFDNGANNIEFKNVFIYHVANHAFFLHNAFSTNIHDCGAYDTGNGFGAQEDAGYSINNITYQNNYIWALTGQNVVDFYYYGTGDHINTMGNVDLNTYSRYGSENNNFHTYIQTPSADSYYNLAGWQTKYPALDQHSNITPSAYTGGLLYILFNAPGNNVTQSASGTFITPTSNYSFYNGQTMGFQPYTGGITINVSPGKINILN